MGALGIEPKSSALQADALTNSAKPPEGIQFQCESECEEKRKRFGPGSRIRTCGIWFPKPALDLAELHPDLQLKLEFEETVQGG